MRYLIEQKVREPVRENEKVMWEINDAREEAGKGFIARGILKHRWHSVSDGETTYQVIETDDPSILSEWAEAYRNVKKFKISIIMTSEEYKGE